MLGGGCCINGLKIESLRLFQEMSAYEQIKRENGLSQRILSALCCEDYYMSIYD